MGLIWTLIKWLQPYTGPAVVLGYPLYASIRAIESPFKEDDQQWLTYWVVYSFMTLLELAAERVLAWIPLWSAMKFAACCWLILPPFQGATFIYKRYVHNRIFKDEELHEVPQDHEQKILRMMKPRTQEAAMQYITDNGQDNFEKLMKVAAKRKTLKTPKSAVRVFFEKKNSK